MFFDGLSKVVSSQRQIDNASINNDKADPVEAKDGGLISADSQLSFVT